MNGNQIGLAVLTFKIQSTSKQNDNQFQRKVNISHLGGNTMSCQGNIEVRSFGSGARRKLTENRSWGLLLVPFQISSAIFGADRNITELC